MSKTILIILGFGLIAFIAAVVFIAPARTCLIVLASRLVADGDVQVVRNIAYGAHARQSLDHYRDETKGLARAHSLAAVADDAVSAGQKPIVIFFYGGGWTSGDKSIYHSIGAALAKRGFEVVIPNYRLFPEVQFPDFVHDAVLAYEWVWHNLAQKGTRPIFVMGHSAGAHIAALLAYDQRYLENGFAKQFKSLNKSDLAFRPSGFIGLAGPYAFDPTTWPSTKHIFSNVTSADHARPVHFVNENSPPTLLFHGQKDDVVKLWNQQELTDALKRKGVFVNATVVPEVGHIGLLLNLGLPLGQRDQLFDKITQFISQD